MRVRIPRFFWTLILAGLVGFSLSGCLTREEYSQEDIQALIDAEVEKKIDQFTSTKLERCREELIAEASQMADSILIDEAYFERDTLLRPVKPEKPEKNCFFLAGIQKKSQFCAFLKRRATCRLLSQETPKIIKTPFHALH